MLRRLSFLALPYLLSSCLGGGASESELRVYAPSIVQFHVQDGDRKLATIPCAGPTSAVLRATVTGMKPVTSVTVRVEGQAGELALQQVGGADSKRFELRLSELLTAHPLDCQKGEPVRLVLRAADLDGWATETDPLALGVSAATAH
jgi:hypothetical protein